MKLPLHPGWRHVLFLTILLLAGTLGAQAQNGIIGTGFSTGWTNPTNITSFSASAGSSRILIKNANGTGNQYFRLVRNWSGNNTEYGPFGCVDAQLTPNNEYLSAPSCGSGAFYFNVTSTSYNYVFKTKDGATGTDFVHFLIQGPVRSVANASDVTRTSPSGTIYPGQAVTIQAVLNGTPSTGQGVYVRYTNDGWTTSSATEMTLVSGSTYSASIPAATNGASKTVSYYILTSGTGKTITSTNSDWYTINSQTNGGSNFSYTVAASWLSAGNGNWTSPTTWTGGIVPPTGQPVTIQNGHTVTLNTSTSQSGITIASGGTLFGSDGTTRTLTLASGFFVNNGTYTPTSTGTIAFTGTSSISGSTSTTFNDLSIQGAGLSFGTSSTVSKSLTVLPSGFVASGALTYGSTAKLIYSTGGGFGIGNEWPSSGGPATVQTTNSTLRINGSRTLTGDLIIGAGGGIEGPSTSATNTITFTGSPSTFQMDGTMDPNPGSGRNLAITIGSGTTYLRGSFGNGSSNTNFRMYDLTVNSGATLQAMPTGGYNTTFELEYGSLVNNGVIDFSPTGGSIVNVTTRGTSGNTYSFSGSGTTQFNGLLVGTTSTLTLNNDIKVKGYLTVATPSAVLIPSGDRYIEMTGSPTYMTQQVAIDPNPSFGNTLSFNVTNKMTIQSAVELFHLFVRNGATVEMVDGGIDYSIHTRLGATVQVDSGGTLKTGTLFGGDGIISSSNGGGTFTLKAGGLLVCRAYANGLNSSGSIGPIQTATRNFSSKGIYQYDGSQAMNSGVFTTTPTANTVRSLYVNITGGNALTLGQNLESTYRTDLVQGNMALGGFTLTADSILELRSNLITGSGAVNGKRFVRTSYSGGLSGTGAAIPAATLTLADGGTTEYYGSTGTQFVSSRSDYGYLLLSGGSGNTGKKQASGDLTLRRNWTRTGADFAPSTYKVTFADSSQATISAPGSELFNKLAILKDTGRVTMQISLKVLDSLKVLKGKLFTSSNVLTLDSTGYLTETIGAVDYYVVGLLSHRRNVGAGATTMGGTGLEMSAGANLGHVTLIRNSGPGVAISGESPCCSGNTSINRTWQVTPEIQPATANRYLSFRWPSEDDNGKDVSQFQLWKSPDGAQPYVRFGIVQNASTTDPRVANGGPVSSFSIFTGTEDATPLPVTWLGFTGMVKGDKAHLNWQTAHEVNALRFTVERSVDGRSFAQAGTVAAVNKDGQTNNYAFADAGFPGAAYYRILETDQDGTTAYSKTIYLKVGTTPTPKPILYPNPLAKGATLTYGSSEAGLHSITLYSSLGQELAQSQQLSAAELSLWLGEKAAMLPAGAYVVRALTPSAAHVLRWVKE